MGCMAASGLANAMGKCVVAIAGKSPFCNLLTLSFVTSVLSNLMSNTATVAIMAPIGDQLCQAQGLSYKTTVLVLIFASNCCFATPFCTSTNMIIKEPGGYTFMDYVRFGLPLQLLLLVANPLACALIFVL